MNERLTVSQILVLTAYAIGMSGGQLLFKIAAMRPALAHGPAVERLLGLLQNVPFLLALLLYAGFAILWVWILSFTPLSRAYPFVALCSVTPCWEAFLRRTCIATAAPWHPFILGALLVAG
jgi:hypothetical protein